MSIVSVAAGSKPSKISDEQVFALASELNVQIQNAGDAADYLLLLRSLESVLENVKDSPEYIHPDLAPQQTIGHREYRTPKKDKNPFNAWSYQCDISATNPTSNSLRGRTITIKDNISVGGLPTTLGTFPEVFSSNGVFPVSSIDSTVVARVLSAGAVIKGTSTCENHCASPLSFTSATGPVHNPLLHGYTAGGSSSGACALVAANELIKHNPELEVGDVVELAIGGDQAGSVRNPASYNGLYGLKPTFGLVPYTGAASMSPMIDHLGPIASSLEDIAVLLQVMAGYDGIDPRMTPESPMLDQVKDYPQLLEDFKEKIKKADAIPDPAAKPIMKVGLLKESFEITGLASVVRDTVYQSAKTYFEAAGAEVTEISIPMHLEAPKIWTASTRPSMSDWLCQGKASGHLSYLPPHLQARWPPSQQVFELLSTSNPALVNIILSGQFAHRHFGPSLEAKAHRKVFELRAAYDKTFKEFDVLITPTAPTIAMPHPDPGARILKRLEPAIGLTSNTCPFNVTGHPAMSVPCGSSSDPAHPEVKLPIGMQIVGRRWDDETVLNAAALFNKGRLLYEKPQI